MPLLDDLTMYARFASGLRAFLQTPILLNDAQAIATKRLAERGQTFHARVPERCGTIQSGQDPAQSRNIGGTHQTGAGAIEQNLFSEHPRRWSNQSGNGHGLSNTDSETRSTGQACHRRPNLESHLCSGGQPKSLHSLCV